MRIQARDEEGVPREKLVRGRPRGPAREASPSRRGTGFRALRGFRSAPRRWTTCSVRFPVARIEEVMADRAETHFGDERHHSLVMTSTHPLADVVDECRIETGGDQLGRTQAAIDEVIQDEVRLRVGESELALVGLTLPEVRARRLAYDDVRHTEEHRHLAQLSLVEIADGIEVAGHVTVSRPVAEEQLGLVARSQHEAVGPSAVVLDRFPLARHLVAAPYAIDVAEASEVRVDLWRDVDLLKRDTERLRDQTSVLA